MGIALVMQDRRDAKRLALNVPVEINGQRPGLTRDISATGMRFQSEQTFEVGEAITVEFRVGGKPDRATGTVVRSSERETAVRFDRPSSVLALN